MAEEDQVVVYVPTEAEKIFIRDKCHEVIGVLEDMSLEQKALVLKLVTSSFTKIYGVRSIEVVRHDE